MPDIDTSYYITRGCITPKEVEPSRHTTGTPIATFSITEKVKTGSWHIRPLEKFIKSIYFLSLSPE
jgi:hypothetical protein